MIGSDELRRRRDELSGKIKKAEAKERERERKKAARRKARVSGIFAGDIKSDEDLAALKEFWEERREAFIKEREEAAAAASSQKQETGGNESHEDKKNQAG